MDEAHKPISVISDISVMYKDDKMKHLWRPKSKSRVCSNVFSEYIQDYPTVNLGYNATVKLLVPAVAGSKRALTYISSTNNSVQSISMNTKH